MRPVNIGNPPTYPYYTAASLTANITYQANKAVAIVYNATVGAITGPTTFFTVMQTMRELLRKGVNKQPYPNPISPALCAQARNNMREALTTRYRPARDDLNAMIGTYCSYCEIPIRNHTGEVEHRAAKENYPTFFVWWWNFILGCKPCNTKKGQKPPRATTQGWATAAGTNPNSENDLYDQIVANYYWPDQDTGTYRIIGRQYFYDTDTGAPVQINAPDYKSRLNRGITYLADSVKADVWAAGAMHNGVYIQARIYNNGGGNPGTQTVAADWVGLGDAETERATLRTRAWLSCCKQLSRLFEAVKDAQPMQKTAAFLREWENLLELAVVTGFYSTWLDILVQTRFPVGVLHPGYTTLGEKFAFDTNPANNADPDQTIPGTDYTSVP